MNVCRKPSPIRPGIMIAELERDPSHTSEKTLLSLSVSVPSNQLLAGPSYTPQRLLSEVQRTSFNPVPHIAYSDASKIWHGSQLVASFVTLLTKNKACCLVHVCGIAMTHLCDLSAHPLQMGPRILTTNAPEMSFRRMGSDPCGSLAGRRLRGSRSSSLDGGAAGQALKITYMRSGLDPLHCK
jgi:hypothetical protein